MLRFALLASLPLFAYAPNASADCAAFGLLAKPITPPGTAVPGDGGILVAAVPDPGGKLDPGDAALKAPWLFKGVATNALWRSLAPGLATLVVHEKATEVVDLKGKSVLKVKHTKEKLPLLGAPKVNAVTFVSRPSRRNNVSVMVSVDELPGDAVAIVLSDAKGKPKSWGLIESKAPGTPKLPIELRVFFSGECTALPNGTVPSKTGDSVIVQFVDQVGRLSAATKPITIKAAP